MTDDKPGDEAAITRLRLIHIVTHTSNPHDVTAIARVEMAIEGGDCRIDAPQHHLFGGGFSACTRRDLDDAANTPNKADILVAHDLARTRELMPAAITSAASWIGTGPLLVQAFPDAPYWDPEAVIAWLGLMPVLDGMTGISHPVCRQAGAAALITCHVIKRLGLRRSIRFSTYPTKPLQAPPIIEDDEGWAHLPLSDLKWLATFAEGAEQAGLVAEDLLDPAIGNRALREYNRRRIWTTRLH